MHTTDPLTVGEIARRSGFAESAVRYYEGLGLLSATRTAGGQRRFERSTLRRLAFIRAARNVGLSLDEVAEALASLPAGRTPTRADWARLSRGWRQRLDDQIAALQQDGTCWCGPTTWHGRRAMRVSVSGWNTTEDDVDASVAAVRACAGR